MPIQNAEIVDVFNRYATLLEIEGANPFRVRAYRRAARTILDLPHSLASMIAEGADLSELPGIGKDLAGKIEEIVDTGRLHELEDFERESPGALVELTALPGLGPKRVRELRDELGIDSLQSLKSAVEAGRLRSLPGFGEKTEGKILRAIERHQEVEKRTKLAAAEHVADSLLRHLKQVEGVQQAIVAGSYRRRQATVGDLDILVTCRNGAKVMDQFVSYEDVDEIVSKGKTRSTVLLRSGLQVDLRVVPQASYGAALHYFTGSKAHNIAVRKLAVARGWKLNEYGIFKGEMRIAGRDEEEVFRRVGLPYIEPELREDHGEIEAAKHGTLPKLISLEDICGDLHTHSKASDGRNTIAEMAEAAKQHGYAYVAISDHTKHVTIAHGLDAKRLGEQIRKIDALNERIRGLRILKSAEVDILENGSLDLPDSILKELDLTVCAIHYKFDLPVDAQTERIIRAMDNPFFNILAHPTGRLIGERDAYDIDMERIMKAALERGCYLEVNAQPERLDLTEVHCRLAKDLGLKVAISTDAHTTTTLDYMRFGVGQARRGWLEPDDVLNTRRWPELKKLLKRP